MNTFILTLLKKRGKLKITSLFHLLKGKKTSSILVYGYFYDLLPYFGLFKELEKNTFEKQMSQLAKKYQLNLKDGWLYSSSHLDSLEEELSLPFLDGLRFNTYDQNHWQLFLFSLQVVSQKIHHHKDYDVLLDGFYPQQQMKWWLKTQNFQDSKVQDDFYQEIYQLFSQLPLKTAEILSLQFHGFNQLGQAPQQLYSKPYPMNYLMYTNDIHAFLTTKEKENSPLLSALLKKNQTSVDYSSQMILKGANFSQLKKLRPNLKESTLRDHVIEVAIRETESFPFELYLTKDVIAFSQKITSVPLVDWSYTWFKEASFDFLNYRLTQIFLKEGEKNRLRS